MPKQIRNGVCLASAWGPLHEYAISARQLFGDFKLFAIGRLAQQNIVILVPDGKPARLAWWVKGCDDIGRIPSCS